VQTSSSTLGGVVVLAAGRVLLRRAAPDALQ